MKNKKMNNKGFSLVELIIVIAIMAVLVGVLAPQFMKYVDQGRRSTDIQNAAMIRDAILADIADSKITSDKTGATFVDYTGSPGTTEICASTITKAPKVQSSLSGATAFTVTCDVTEGTCSVFLGTYELTDADVATNYKNGD